MLFQFLILLVEGDSEPQKWTGESSFSCGACSGKVIFQLDGLESKEKTGEQFIYCSPQLSGKEMPFIQVNRLQGLFKAYYNHVS